MNQSNFISLAFNPAMKMNEIRRYASVYQQVEENLAEHTSEVSMFSYLIAQYLAKSCQEKIDIGVLLTKCLLHDVDEVVTGDIPRNTKYGNEQILSGCKTLAKDSIKLIESCTLGEVCLEKEWIEAKNGKEGLILKISDMLVVVKKAITEVELHNNLSFLKVVKELEGHLSRMVDFLSETPCAAPEEESSTAFNSKSYEFLKNLVSEAQDEIVTIRVKYQHIIDKYSIKENIIKGGENV